MAQPRLQAMDVTSLRAVLTELHPQLVPSRFEKAQQSDGQSLQLGFRSLEGRHWLELSWQAEAPRLFAIPAPPRAGEGSTLAQQLQHGLGGLALVGLEQQGWERVVELGFAERPGGPLRRSLVLELMGRHSNLFLLDEQRRVIAAGRQVRPQQSRLRPIGTGDPYQPPPPLPGLPPSSSESFAAWQRQLSLLPVSLLQALQGAYQGISPSLAQQLVPEATLLQQSVQRLEPRQWQQLWQRWQGWLSCLEQGAFGLELNGPCDYTCWGGAPPPLTTQPSPGNLPINRFLADYHSRILGRRRAVQRLQQLRQALEQNLRKQQQQAEQQQALLLDVENSDALQRQADALLCLQQPSRDQVDQAQALYRRARKLRRSVAAITPRLELHQQRSEQLETSLTFLEQLEIELESQGPSPDWLAQLQALDEDSEALLQRQAGLGRRQRARARTAASPEPLELHSPGGLLLQVGRNHRQNEWISLRQARRGDLWFHAQECPGSHVVLKASQRQPGDADLQAAADLAAHFSRGRGNGRVPVLVVPSEDLQRIPGAGPGTVRHRGGAVLWG